TASPAPPPSSVATPGRWRHEAPHRAFAAHASAAAARARSVQPRAARSGLGPAPRDRSARRRGRARGSHRDPVRVRRMAAPGPGRPVVSAVEEFVGRSPWLVHRTEFGPELLAGAMREAARDLGRVMSEAGAVLPLDGA